MLLRKYLALLFAAGALAATPSYASSVASSITSFTFTPTSEPFTTVAVETSSGSQASLTGSVTCASTNICSGEVGAFTLGLALDEPSTPFFVEISGDNLGATTASGTLDIIGFPSSIPFTVKPGVFDEILVNTSLPQLGDVTLDGTLDLALAPGQEITLPLTFNVGSPTTATPEPFGVGLLLGGFLAVAGFARYRYQRAD